VLDSARLLFDLQNVGQIVQSISGCLDTRTIAHHLTDALVAQFDCVFARLWIVENDQNHLKLIASSGLHTHTDGSFARVPMGAYKVGKIAQNRIPFLSNQLAAETWVKDREWAIANQIQGFAGYPLATNDRVIGVLAAFSTRPMAPEFLEVLQVLCMTATIALDAALQMQPSTTGTAATVSPTLPLSDQLAAVLQPTGLMLVGTEHPTSATVAHALLQAAEHLSQQDCNYCRLSYTAEAIVLNAILAVPEEVAGTGESWLRSQFAALRTITTWLRGMLDLQLMSDRRTVQFRFELPDTPSSIQATNSPTQLSEREVEVMTLLAQGLRDRDIAQKLYISESTVKFHINNSLSKLQAKNRYQGVYQAAIQGFI
jgi:DNA-binding CsgD family transcriptional regulator